MEQCMEKAIQLLGKNSINRVLTFIKKFANFLFLRKSKDHNFKKLNDEYFSHAKKIRKSKKKYIDKKEVFFNFIKKSELSFIQKDFNLAIKLFHDIISLRTKRIYLYKRKINFSIFSTEEMLHLYRIFIRLGRMEEAYFIRNRASLTVLKDSKNYVKYLGYLFEKNQIRKLNKIYIKNFSKKNYEHMDRLGQILKINRKNDDFKDIDKTLFDKVNKKKLMIIGPLRNFKLKNYNYDFYVFFNNFDIKNISFLKKIRFYSGSFVLSQSNSKINNFLKKNFINIFQYKKHYEIFKKKNPDQNIYYNRINIDRLFNGKMAGLQRATLNLLLHNPKNFHNQCKFFFDLNYKKIIQII